MRLAPLCLCICALMIICTAQVSATPCRITADEIDVIRYDYIDSRAMGRRMPYVVQLPESFAAYNSEDPDARRDFQPYPLVVVLHGWDADECALLPALSGMATWHGIVLLYPTMEGDGGWFNSPIRPDYRYEDMVMSEIVPHVLRNYPVHTDGARHAITGFSMGGQGALMYAIKHPHAFGAVGSISGILDIRLHAGKWGMHQMLGAALLDGRPNPVYTRYSITAGYADALPAIQARSSLFILIEAGRQDFAYADAQRFVEKLDALNVRYEAELDHDGRHSFAYFQSRIHRHIERLVRVIQSD